MSFLDIGDPLTPVLVVVAHPDDIDFGIAGTIARMTDAGSDITYCLVTSGEAGAPDNLSRPDVAEIREGEQRVAAAAVGVTKVHFLRQPDGRLQADLKLRQVITRLIRKTKPKLVITHNPNRRWDNVYGSHPDHLAVGEATMSAVYPDARNPHAHPELTAEGLEPHAVKEVWVAGLEPFNVFIDITEVFDRKVAALKSHKSQLQQNKFEAEPLLHEWGTRLTSSNSLPDGRITEAFRRINTE